MVGAMGGAEWDEARFRASIPAAKESVELAARFYTVGPTLPEWESQRPVVDLVFYLARLDYDLKVLLLHFLADPDNRTVWERYLALELHEGLQTVPQAISRARREIAKPSTPSRLSLARFDAAAGEYRWAVKAIREDVEFYETLTTVRNGVAAHHGMRRGAGMEVGIAWTLSAWNLTESGNTPFQSKFGEYAVKFGRAIQDFGISVVGEGEPPGSTHPGTGT